MNVSGKKPFDPPRRDSKKISPSGSRGASGKRKRSPLAVGAKKARTDSACSSQAGSRDSSLDIKEEHDVKQEPMEHGGKLMISDT